MLTKSMLSKNFTVCQMNKLILVFIVVTCSQSAKAQTYNEWFKQKETQKKYLEKQIAALKVYLGYVKDGYKIINKGLTAVGDIKQGKFDLDIEYLTSLKNVNPAVSKSAKVAGIIVYQRRIMTEFRKLKGLTNESDLFTKEEKQYIESVYAIMLRESELSLDELDRVLGDSTFQMKDDERVKHVDGLFIDMKDKYAFTKSFSNSTGLLIAQRSKDMHEVLVQRDLILK
jgi:hypothetical protein